MSKLHTDCLVFQFQIVLPKWQHVLACFIWSDSNVSSRSCLSIAQDSRPVRTRCVDCILFLLLVIGISLPKMSKLHLERLAFYFRHNDLHSAAHVEGTSIADVQDLFARYVMVLCWHLPLFIVQMVRFYSNALCFGDPWDECPPDNFSYLYALSESTNCAWSRHCFAENERSADLLYDSPRFWPVDCRVSAALDDRLVGQKNEFCLEWKGTTITYT